MKIEELIKRLQAIQAEHGNLHVFSESLYELQPPSVSAIEDYNCPDEWNMPQHFIVLQGFN